MWVWCCFGVPSTLLAPSKTLCQLRRWNSRSPRLPPQETHRPNLASIWRFWWWSPVLSHGATKNVGGLEVFVINPRLCSDCTPIAIVRTINNIMCCGKGIIIIITICAPFFVVLRIRDLRYRTLKSMRFRKSPRMACMTTDTSPVVLSSEYPYKLQIQKELLNGSSITVANRPRNCSASTPRPLYLLTTTSRHPSALSKHVLAHLVQSPLLIQVPTDLFVAHYLNFRLRQSPHPALPEAHAKGAQARTRSTSVLVALDPPPEAQSKAPQMQTCSTSHILLLPRWPYSFQSLTLVFLMRSVHSVSV